MNHPLIRSTTMWRMGGSSSLLQKDEPPSAKDILKGTVPFVSEYIGHCGQNFRILFGSIKKGRLIVAQYKPPRRGGDYDKS